MEDNKRPALNTKTDQISFQKMYNLNQIQHLKQ